MAPVYFYIEHRFPRRTFNTLIKLFMTTVHPLSQSPYISLLDCYIPFFVRKPLAQYPGMEIEPIVSGSAIFRALNLDSLFSNNNDEFPFPQQPGRRQHTKPLHYYMNELKANSEDDIRAGDETLNAIFDGDKTLGAIFARCEDHALGVGGGAASAGRTAAPPQGGLSLADDDESGAASAPPTLPSGP
jgi:hypothetical protein